MPTSKKGTTSLQRARKLSPMCPLFGGSTVIPDDCRHPAGKRITLGCRVAISSLSVELISMSGVAVMSRDTADFSRKAAMMMLHKQVHYMYVCFWFTHQFLLVSSQECALRSPPHSWMGRQLSAWVCVCLGFIHSWQTSLWSSSQALISNQLSVYIMSTTQHRAQHFQRPPQCRYRYNAVIGTYIVDADTLHSKNYWSSLYQNSLKKQKPSTEVQRLVLKHPYKFLWAYGRPLQHSPSLVGKNFMTRMGSRESE